MGLRKKNSEYNNAMQQISQTIPVQDGGRSIVTGNEYMSGNQSILSGGSGSVLPDLKKINNRNMNSRPSNTSGLQSSGGHSATLDSTSKLRKASPEALALMMANKKKNDATSQSSSHWVPGGKSTMQRDNSRQRKLFY